jgi:hypothetical protein
MEAVTIYHRLADGSPGHTVWEYLGEAVYFVTETTRL